MSDLEKRIRAMIESAEPCALYDLAGIHFELMEQEKAHDAERAALLARLEQAERERDEARQVTRSWYEAFREMALVAGVDSVAAGMSSTETIAAVGREHQALKDVAMFVGSAYEKEHRERDEARADRDAWKARAEAGLDVSPEDAGHLIRLIAVESRAAEYHKAIPTWVTRVMAALRAHARKAVTG